MSKHNIKTEEFNRIKVEDTKTIDANALHDALDGNYEEEELQKLTVDELQYILEYEDCDKEKTAIIKKLIKQKK